MKKLIILIFIVVLVNLVAIFILSFLGVQNSARTNAISREYSNFIKKEIYFPVNQKIMGETMQDNWKLMNYRQRFYQDQVQFILLLQFFILLLVIVLFVKQLMKTSKIKSIKEEI